MLKVKRPNAVQGATNMNATPGGNTRPPTRMTGREDPTSIVSPSANNSNVAQSAPTNFTRPLVRADIENITDSIRAIILGKIKEKYNGVNDDHFNNFFKSIFVPNAEGATTRASWSNSIILDVVIPENRLDLVIDYLTCQFADTYHDARGVVTVYSGPGGIYDADHYVRNLFDSWIQDLETARKMKNSSNFLGNFHTIDMLPALKNMRSRISDFTNVVKRGTKKQRRGNADSIFKKILAENAYLTRNTRKGQMPAGGGWERKFLYGADPAEKTGVLGLIKNEFSKNFIERKYCIQSSVRRPVNNVNSTSGIIIDMTQQAHGGARRIYGEWRAQKIMHISSLDDAGQGLLGENDWIKSIVNQYVSMTGLDPNLANGCGTAERHLIDFKPFTFRMSYEIGDMKIPIIDVRMEIDKPNIRNALVRKNIPLTKVTINGISGLNMTSKSGSFGTNNAIMKKMANGRSDWWHLQLMQKYIGDFMPIVYSFQRDVYYTTGDNMAIVQYLNMARLLKTENVITRSYKYIAGQTATRNVRHRLADSKEWVTSDVKFKMIAEDGKEGLIRLFLSHNLLRS
jgi:hypothetical protein